ncbi:hypothetical protein F4703DRAFT_1793722 [Phycomyces blakesleeanus]
MLASEVPFEILTKIANLLQPSELRTCTVVCKSWHDSFNEVIWREVTIETDIQLEKLCDISTAEENPYQDNGHLVRILALDQKLVMTVEKLNAIRSQFPHLQSLSIELSRNLFPRDIPAVFDVWPSLTQLHISPSRIAASDGVKEFLKFMTFFPNLRVLFCTEFSPFRTRPFNLIDIETLHDILPQLEVLRIGSVFAPLSSEDVLSLEKVVPARKLVKLRVGFLNLDSRWLCYYVHKYPNLRGFTLYNHGGMHRKSSYEEARAMFPKLSNCFPYLETLNLTGFSPTAWSHIALADLIFGFNNSIKHFSTYLRTNVEDPGIQQAVKSCMRVFPATIVSLRITSEFNFTDLEALPTALGACHHLKYLYMGAKDVSVQLDTILDNSPALKMLTLKQVNISLSPGAPEAPALHGLRLLYIDADETDTGQIDTELFSYISVRCRQLRYMSLHGAQITCSNVLSTDSLCFSMPHTNLKYLQLENISYQLPKMHSGQESRNMVIFIQKDAPLESGNSGADYLFIKSSLMPIAKSTWLQMYFDRKTQNSLVKLRVLTEGEAEIAERYSNSTELDNILCSSSSDESAVFLSPLEATTQNLLSRGFVSFIFGSVGRYDFCMDSDSNVNTWEIIHNKEYALLN